MSPPGNYNSAFYCKLLWDTADICIAQGSTETLMPVEFIATSFAMMSGLNYAFKGLIESFGKVEIASAHLESCFLGPISTWHMELNLMEKEGCCQEDLGTNPSSPECLPFIGKLQKHCLLSKSDMNKTFQAQSRYSPLSVMDRLQLCHSGL